MTILKDISDTPLEGASRLWTCWLKCKDGLVYGVERVAEYKKTNGVAGVWKVLISTESGKCLHCGADTSRYYKFEKKTNK